jgi:hypothetical protein
VPRSDDRRQAAWVGDTACAVVDMVAALDLERDVLNPKLLSQHGLEIVQDV